MRRIATWLCTGILYVACSKDSTVNDAGTGGQGDGSDGGADDGNTGDGSDGALPPSEEACRDICQLFADCGVLDTSRVMPESQQVCESTCIGTVGLTSEYLYSIIDCVEMADECPATDSKFFVGPYLNCEEIFGPSEYLPRQICNNPFVECGDIGEGGTYSCTVACIWAGTAWAFTDPDAFADWEICMRVGSGCDYVERCGPLP